MTRMSNSPMSPAEREDLQRLARQRQYDIARAALVLRRDRALADADRLVCELERYPSLAARQRLAHEVALVDRLDEMLSRRGIKA
jgi:hypothetical protein